MVLGLCGGWGERDFFQSLDIRAIYTSTEEVKGRGLLFQKQAAVLAEELLIEKTGLWQCRRRRSRRFCCRYLCSGSRRGAVG
ncbi:hypothetical protein JEQ12_017088 [Ovis aries]|uniref:Uncharacterized protein n=1 Tax=Ovis aries TaxID=9940 RepID=A0A836AH25_SHEEP|nr:hypothetical protein JEQ12_017088 [Ovis aries]